MKLFTSDVENSPTSVGGEDGEGDGEQTSEAAPAPAPADANAAGAELTMGIAEILCVRRMRRMSTTEVESEVVRIVENVPMFRSRTVRFKMRVS